MIGTSLFQTCQNISDLYVRFKNKINILQIYLKSVWSILRVAFLNLALSSGSGLLCFESNG